MLPSDGRALRYRYPPPRCPTITDNSRPPAIRPLYSPASRAINAFRVVARTGIGCATVCYIDRSVETPPALSIEIRIGSAVKGVLVNREVNPR